MINEIVSNKEISIIIPVYNVEKYIGDCVDSVLKQKFTDFECLIIDDGSTDSSMRIAEWYAQKDRRIKLIKQCTNKGVSATRNLGVNEAHGKYICFIDADDRIEPDFLKKMYECAEEKKLDLVISGYVYENKGKIFSGLIKSKERVMDPKETIKEMLLKSRFDWSPCDKLFLREKLVAWNIFFNVKHKMGEDLEFIWNYIKHIKRVGFIPLYSYHYIVNMNSATHRRRTDLRLDSVSIMKSIKDDVFVNGETKTYERIRELYAKEIASCIKDIIVKKNNKYKVKELQKELRKNIGVIYYNKDFSFFIKCAMLFFCLPYYICYYIWKVIEKLYNRRV